MANKTILVTGSNGQLGSELKDAFANKSVNIIYTDVQELDITNKEAVRNFIRVNSINLVINCAAYTAVDRAEDEPQISDLINHIAVDYIASALKEVNGKLIHISTDYVFNGKASSPYHEGDLTSPIGVYGKTKLAGEQAVLASGCDCIIIRTSWLYSVYGANFVKTIMRFARERGELKVIADQVGSPTNARDLARAIVTIVQSQKWESGIYHYSNEGVCSWYDFAKAIVDIANIKCKVNACTTAEYPTKAVRPPYSVFEKTKIKSIHGIEVPYWRDSLIDCIAVLNK
jgi:dTDP-4-dehydrorhamnose reductase